MSGYPVLLKSQHDEIKKNLDLLSSHWKQKNIGACTLALEEIQKLLRTHHRSECQDLFEKIRTEARLSQGGGPFCSYFFDFFMNNRPRDLVERKISQIRATSTTMEIPQDLKPYFDENSLLCIPLEEHIAVQALTDELLDVLKAGRTDNVRWIDEVLTNLDDLIRLNFQKEETCLWEAFKASRPS